MKELLLLAMKNNCEYQFRYYDYKKNEFTVPVLLTDARIERLLDDLSIAEIRLIIKP